MLTARLLTGALLAPRPRQQLPRGFLGRRGDAAEHGGEFVDALIAGHLVDFGPAAGAVRVLADDEVLASEGGNLRQVGDAEDLVAFGKTGERFADEWSGATAHALVNFVEDNRLGAGGLTEDGRQSEEEA